MRPPRSGSKSPVKEKGNKIMRPPKVVKGDHSSSPTPARPKNLNYNIVDDDADEPPIPEIDIELGDLDTKETTTSTASNTNSQDEKKELKKGRSKTSESAASPVRSDSKQSNSIRESKSSRFKGKNVLQYTLWAHYLSIGASSMCLCMGFFSALWTNAHTYHCKINGQSISSNYLYLSDGSCPTVYVNPGGQIKEVCCDPNADPGLEGYLIIGLIYIFYSFFILFYENTTWGYGLWQPNDTVFYRNRISPIGLLHMVVGIAGLYNYATCLGGSCLMVAGGAYIYAALRNEAGDGDREYNRKEKEKKKVLKSNEDERSAISYLFTNPCKFVAKVYKEDKLSTYFWLFIYIALNAILFSYTVYLWYLAVDAMKDGLLNGTIAVQCDTLMCHVNRKVVKYGPISHWAPWAKGCGNCLNMNCSLLLLPVVKMILRKINNMGETFDKSQKTDCCSHFFAHPFTRYIPLNKNIEFHKLCAIMVFIYSWLHVIFHYANLYTANYATLRIFHFLQWDGTDYFTGAVVTFAMFIIYSGAFDRLRRVKYEIFFNTHQWFILFYVAMFLHGPRFFYWTCIPVILYIFERLMQFFRGSKPYLVSKVEWIPPVMAIYFRPAFKEDLIFKEGQYLYLNCPHISPSEWHPFTISSAYDDLNNGPRIHLETGEEVVEVPRPKNLPANAKWNKYCLASQDYQAMDPNDYIDKSETGYNDYITVHIKVFGLEDPHARTWTRKLKEYFELLSPGKKFPFYFNKRDARGEITIGRQYGPDGKDPILRVDGPHSAPAQHYVHYGTLMLIGAGIGLTPCVSIMTSLVKYRWKKNFHPEILHFYWVIRYNEIESYQWLVHQLTELCFTLKKGRYANQIEKRYYLEINIYVTGYDANEHLQDKSNLHRSKKNALHNVNINSTIVSPTFQAEQLYEKLLNPTVDSKGQISKMKNQRQSTNSTLNSNSENRLQDIWIWNGRPHWDEIFQEMKDQRQHRDIGVCFCGTPAIGSDLKNMCEKYSSRKEDVLFSLHKENF